MRDVVNDSSPFAVGKQLRRGVGKLIVAGTATRKHPGLPDSDGIRRRPCPLLHATPSQGVDSLHSLNRVNKTVCVVNLYA